MSKDCYSFNEPIHVTAPLLPPLEDFTRELRDVWESGWLTNNGPKVRLFEQSLSAFLKTPNLTLFNNGTIALIVACQALRLSGEVITSPFTFAATPHVLTWNNITPVFCDIDDVTLTLDPRKIERLITARTTAILGVHVYGMPCDVFAIKQIADEYGLRVVYDGAHAFCAELNGQPITDFGDATMLSFHATKLFHTAEGGALAVPTLELKHRIELLKNFGIKNEVDVVMPGINGKMNELQAALGLLNLRLIEEEREARSSVAKIYRERLDGVEGITCFSLPPNVRDSMQYFVIRVNASTARISRDELYFRLREYNVYARRYFYPLCSDYNCYRSLPSAAGSSLPVAQRVSREVLALPFYGELGESNVHRICDIILFVVGNSK